MAALPNVLLCAVLASLLSTLLGYPVARMALPVGWSALAAAPALGWALFTAAAFPLLLIAGCNRLTVTALIAGTLAGSLAATLTLRGREAGGPALPAWAFLLAGLAACAPAVAMLPKFVGDGVILAAPAFDHSKVAIIDQIARQGLPVGNPFLGGPEAPDRLVYYYLWQFGAALMALPLGASGWEADAALTWFTALASLLLMMGMARWLGGSRWTAVWIVAFSLAGSLRSVIEGLLGVGTAQRLLSTYASFGSWIGQASWSPHHLAAASSTVLAFALIARLPEPGSWPLVPATALLVAAAFGSSTWVGGVTLGLAAVPVGLLLLLRPGDAGWAGFLLRAGAAALLALVLVFPILRDQLAAAGGGGGPPIAFHPYEVLGPAMPEAVRRLLDLPAYWLLRLGIDFPALYLPSVAGLAAMLWRGREGGGGGQAQVLGLLTLGSLAVAWLLASTLLNNDLGWRAVLPAVLIGSAAAAARLDRWLAGRRWRLVVPALALAALGLPDGINAVAANIKGRPTPEATAFTWTPDLWQAVRRRTGPAERIANNPLFLGDLTPWPINASWAYLANRPSCYAGWPLVRPFAPLPLARVDAIEAQFIRVFAGKAMPGDAEALAGHFACRLAVVTALDGAWANDPFALSPAWRLVEDRPGRWRLYAAVSG